MNDPTDKLEAMPPSELAEELEAALDAMTEETNDRGISGCTGPQITHARAPKRGGLLPGVSCQASGVCGTGRVQACKEAQKIQENRPCGACGRITCSYCSLARHKPLVLIWLLDLHGGQRVDSVLVRSNLTPPLHTIPPFVTRTPLIFQRNTKSLWQSSRTKGLRRILFLAIFQTDSKSRHLFKQKERQGRATPHKDNNKTTVESI